MKKLMTIAAASTMALAMCSTSFAAWQQDGTGWRYMTGKSTWLTSQYTEDGYWVDVNGYWDGRESIGAKQQDGSYVVVEDPLTKYQILGTRVFKVVEATLNAESKNYAATVDVYDTSFMTSDEIRNIKKGDSFELPGLGITVTAQNKASKGVIHTSSSGAKNGEAAAENAKKDSGYRVRLTDAEGNQYILSASRLRKTSADASTTETILRPVAKGIRIVVPAWRDTSRVNGTSSYSSTKSIMEKKMMFEAVLEGDTVAQIKDTTYNYDTTNTPVYSEDAAHGHLYNVGEY